MNFPTDMLQRLGELSLLPADDPERLRFVAELPSLDGQTRQCWAALLSEEQLLRGALRQVETPPQLLANLNKLIDKPGRIALPGKPLSVPWPMAMAAVLGVLAVGGYFIWGVYHPSVSHQVVQLQTLPPDTVKQIESLALVDYQSPPQLDIPFSDRAALQAALQTKMGSHCSLPVTLPQTPADYHLVGGSVVPLGNGNAVYTQWTHEGHRVALFQFAPANFSIPAAFRAEQGQLNSTLAVALWPGNRDACAWVAIAEQGDPAQLLRIFRVY